MPMKESLQTKLDQLSLRQKELDALLSAEDATRDLDRYRTLSREHAEIGPIVERYREHAAVTRIWPPRTSMAADPAMRCVRRG